MTEAEKAYQYFVIAVPENEEQAKAYFWARKALQSTLPPPNEWVKRMLELDELYTKLQVVTGFTAERLLEMFADGYTLEKPDYAKSFEDMASLAETTPPNEALRNCGRWTSLCGLPANPSRAETGTGVCASMGISSHRQVAFTM